MKNTPLFACENCEAQYQKWSGRCLECGKWGTIKEATVEASGFSKSQTDLKKYAPAKTQKLSEVQGHAQSRITTGLIEMDRVLGGGLVPGSFILLGGEPGIGKSTLALQLSESVPNTLYLSGEESAEQIKLRFDRLQTEDKKPTKKISTLKIGNETNLETIVATIEAEKPTLTVIDSIQTIFSNQVEGEAGNVTQLKACAVKLLEVAKSKNVAIVIIGHVTKEGTVAGPRTLEHLVDTVLYLEGDRYQNIRLLRTVKNRFGNTDEVGMFAMDGVGLIAVANPSSLLLAERGDSMPGSVVTCLMEGTRPLLVEVQALVNKTSFGYPVRKASGFDINRLHVLIAVLEKRAGLSLSQYDVHLNIVGGVKANEPATDLAVALALASAFKDKKLGNDLCVFGEVGLGGEVRSVKFLEKRIKECSQLGMKRVITTKNKNNHKEKGVQVIEVQNIAELIQRGAT